MTDDSTPNNQGGAMNCRICSHAAKDHTPDYCMVNGCKCEGPDTITITITISRDVAKDLAGS